MRKQSNTKYGKAEKRAVISTAMQFLEVNRDSQFFIVEEARAVVLIVPEFKGSKMASVSVSYASTDEKKFRAYIGVDMALEKHYNNEHIKVPLQPDDYANFVARLTSMYLSGVQTYAEYQANKPAKADGQKFEDTQAYVNLKEIVMGKHNTTEKKWRAICKEVNKAMEVEGCGFSADATTFMQLLSWLDSPQGCDYWHNLYSRYD